MKSEDFYCVDEGMGYYQARSFFNNWVGPERASYEEAKKDGEKHRDCIDLFFQLLGDRG